MSTKPAMGKFANWWWCGDEECDCIRPEIREHRTLSKPVQVGPTTYREWETITLEEGRTISGFQSNKEEWDEQDAWMRAACERHNIPFKTRSEYP